MFGAGLEALKEFQFSISNPVFWLSLIILFFIAMRFWKPKKALYFSLVIGGILLATTKTESVIGQAIRRGGETFDPMVLRISALFFIAVVWLYYGFIKSDT